MIVVVYLCLCPLARAQVELVTPDQDLSAAAPSEITRPSVSGRVVRVFDFEGLQLGSIEVPPQWYRAQSYEGVRDRPGFPPYNEGRLDYTVSHSGEGSMMVPSKGGSASMRLFEGEIPVFSRTAYAIEAYVKTQGAHAARASITARFLDEKMRTIVEKRTKQVWSEGKWTKIVVQLDASYPDARSLQIDLELLQEQQRQNSNDTSGIVFRVDYDATAWFDDVRVLQLPKVELLTSHPSNIYVGEEKPELDVRVRDLTGELMRARVDVVDDRGVLIDKHRFQPFGGRLDENLLVELPRYGWYEATLYVDNGSGVDAVDSVTFVWLAKHENDYSEQQLQLTTSTSVRTWWGEGGTRPGSQFGIWFDTMPISGVSTLPAIARQLASRRVKIPIVDEQVLGRAILKQLDLFEPAVFALQAAGHEVILGVDAFPESWTRAWGIMPSQTALAAEVGERDLIDSVLVPVLDRFGDVVERWQFGRVREGWPVPVALRATALATTAHAFAAIAPPDRLMLASGPFDPANSLEAISDAGTLREGVMPVPPGLGTEALKQLIASYRNAAVRGELPNQITYTLTTFDQDLFGQHAAASDLARTTIMLFHGLIRHGSTANVLNPDTTRFAVIDPVSWRNESGTTALPNAEASVWREISLQLSGRMGRSELHLAHNTTCLLFEEREGESFDSGLACIWSEDGAERLLEVPVGLGDVRVIDMNGNTVAFERPERGLIQLLVGHDPVYVEGVDVDLATFRSTFAVEPPELDARSAEQPVRITFANTWDRPVAGRIRVISPGGFREDGSRDRSWEIEPRVHAFALEPGELGSVLMAVRRRIGVATGQQEFDIAIEVQSDAGERTLRHVLPFRVGLSSIDLAASHVKTLRGDAVAVETTNISNDPVSVVLTASIPGQSRHRVYIANLMPGEVTVREFTLPEKVVGSVSVSATVVGDQGMLTSIVELDKDLQASTQQPLLAVEPDDS